jgi:hypothetical protein
MPNPDHPTAAATGAFCGTGPHAARPLAGRVVLDTPYPGCVAGTRAGRRRTVSEKRVDPA